MLQSWLSPNLEAEIMYNRYAASRQPPSGRPSDMPGGFSQNYYPHSPKPPEHNHDIPPRPCQPPPRNQAKDGFLGIFKNIIPASLDAGDIMLFLILFMAYMDSRDEDFLIIMAALFFMISG